MAKIGATPKDEHEPQPLTFLQEVQTAERRQELRLSRKMVGNRSLIGRGTKTKKQTLLRCKAQKPMMKKILQHRGDQVDLRSRRRSKVSSEEQS